MKIALLALTDAGKMLAGRLFWPAIRRDQTY